MAQETHRSGPFKQDNKRHKFGRHRSNRAINTTNKGRKEDIKHVTKRKDLIKRHERRNQMKQLRQNKRYDTIANKRGIGSQTDICPPIVVTILDMNTADDTKIKDSFFELIRNCDPNCIINCDKNDRNIHISFPKLKTRFEFILLDNQDLYSSLDAAKVTDILLLLHSPNDTTDDGNHPILDAIYSHILPTTVHLIHGLDGLSLKKKNDVKKVIQKFINNKFGDEKLRSVDTISEALQLIHFISNCKRKDNAFRLHRSQVLAERLDFSENSDDLQLGTLKIWGYVRNRALDVNSLVHIPGFGDYQMNVIEVLTDPNLFNRKNNKLISNMNIDDNNTNLEFVLRSDPTIQQTLDFENIVDPMEGEQTWPTPEELNAAQESQKSIKKVPKGTSDYQAVWILDNEDDNNSSNDNSESDEEDMIMEANNELDSVDENSEDEDKDDDMDTMSVTTTNEANYDQKIDITEEEAALKKFKDQRLNEMFPDEVDTPIDQPAKVRFARYRGLKSFRTSTWDFNENLPKDYSRICQFENFLRTKKRVFNADESGAQSGWFVCVHVINCPKTVYEMYGNNNKKPLILYSLLEHEHRMSTINLVIKKVSSFSESLKSKESFIFHLGCRRFRASPIFSAHTNGDKHKLERFMRSDVPVVATLYAPITFPPSSVLVYKQREDGSQQLVATGSLLSCNPNRVIVKRIVLSGHPFKINRKHAVVRYMFFNRDDIMWFKPIELRTKYGRKGHIREPLGTHGHMKCVFDRQLNSQDTVLMNLYKRVFPKWTYDSLDNVLQSTYNNNNEKMNQ
ncbi:pre-rRNA-processing protein TSR1 homolog [Oppia nitens]|uniref:pre-rRNA-processing protein TSR1 homolog n=1 Tax=Oppia nitens TaxID=1686743 RepID=UPI0023DCE305|nr:pre-rRNA-processing protein TSR1 homolog [Oppia nitens]